MSNGNRLPIERVIELASKVAEHHNGYSVEISYNLSGDYFWSLLVYKGMTVYSLPSFSYNADKELEQVAENGIDFSKDDSEQLA